jgi:polysaccharide biosynthesis/export protein
MGQRRDRRYEATDMRPLTTFFAILLSLFAGLPQQMSGATVTEGYLVGSEDVITVRVLDIEEFSPQNLAAIRVDNQGNIRLPILGRIHVAGLNVEQIEDVVTKALLSVMQAPEVTVAVTTFGSRPVSVLGAVRNPGVRQISGRQTLLEALSLAGGLNSEAGNSIVITRRIDSGPLPLSDSSIDDSGKFMVGGLKVRAVMQANNPSANIEVLANDVITVPKADLIYVIGAVKKPGGFVLNEKEQVSALQALSMAEGLDNMAGPKAARILRENEPGSARFEIPVDLRTILDGTAPDLLLHANDILFVPGNKAKNVTMRALEVAIQMGVGAAIWR